MDNTYQSDIETILSHRYDQGSDFWASGDGRIYKGNPYSTISSLGMLHELGVDARHEAVQGGMDLIIRASRDDGRVRVAPNAPMYPCYTAEAVRMLCRFGLSESETVRRTVSYFIEHAHESGGWRCNFTKFGRGPETQYANPGATLYVLDVLRFFPEYRKGNEVLNRAVDLLLDHWEIKKPIGPCHWGIGTLFMQVEYPFLRYNIFYYVYILSFYSRAREDARFKEAVEILSTKLNDKEEMVVERPHRNLKELEFCARGKPSEPATARYREIRNNIGE